MADETLQEIEHLRLDRNDVTAAPQFSALGIERMTFEDVNHLPLKDALGLSAGQEVSKNSRKNQARLKDWRPHLGTQWTCPKQEDFMNQRLIFFYTVFLGCAMIGPSQAEQVTVGTEPVGPNRAHLNAATIDQLKLAYLECDWRASDALLDLSEAVYCSSIQEVLKQRGFGGDFDRMLAWWRAEKTAAATLGGDRTARPLLRQWDDVSQRAAPTSPVKGQ